MLSLKPYIAHYWSESCGCAGSGQPTPPLTAHLLERFGNQERQFKRLIGVHAGVASEPNYVFMDEEFNQHELSADDLESELPFIVDGMNDK